MFGSYTVGAVVQNLGQDADLPGPVEAELPRQATLGVSRGGPVGEFDLFGTAAVSWVRSNTLAPAGGLEVNYSWLSGYNIALRAGARRPLPGQEAFTAGAGFTVDRLSIDYALETLERRSSRQSPGIEDSLMPNNRARAAGIVLGLLFTGCTQALQLTKDDSPVVLSHQLISAPNPGEKGIVRRQDALLRQRHRQAPRRVPRLRHDQDEDRRRLAVRHHRA